MTFSRLLVLPFLVITLSLFFSLKASAQWLPSWSQTPKTYQQKINLNACPKCDVACTMRGKCGCGEMTVPMNGTLGYACIGCHHWSKKDGVCRMCKTHMKQAVMTYACEKCHVTSKNKGKCSKCGDTMKQHIMPYYGI
jgi:hypothetical protein